jgi:GNAT superfamily N-acetyltransferase
MKTPVDHYTITDQLKDGRSVTFRAIRSSDKPVLQDVLHHLSPQSIYFRFLTSKKELSDKELVYFTEVDHFHHVALVASVPHKGEMMPVGVGRYIMSKIPYSDDAEVAFTVEDEFQGLGIGTLLFKHLKEIALDAGIKTFTALVLPENQRMLKVFESAGLPMRQKYNAVGVLEIAIDLTGQNQP